MVSFIAAKNVLATHLTHKVVGTTGYQDTNGAAFLNTVTTSSQQRSDKQVRLLYFKLCPSPAQGVCWRRSCLHVQEYAFKAHATASLSHTSMNWCEGAPELRLRAVDPRLSFLLVLGVQKAGTTWLFDALATHPLFSGAHHGYRCAVAHLHWRSKGTQIFSWCLKQQAWQRKQQILVVTDCLEIVTAYSGSPAYHCMCSYLRIRCSA